MWTIILLCVIFILCVDLYRRRVKRLTIFKRLGIPGPKARSLLFGNYDDVFSETSKGYIKQMGGWFEQYGDTFGYYNGDEPFIVSRDMDLVSHVLVKHFSNFYNRGNALNLDTYSDPINNNLLGLLNKRWKDLRTQFTRSFTASKLKQMYPVMQERSERFLQIVEQHRLQAQNKEFNIYPIFQMVSLDLITKSAYGFEVNSLDNQQHSLLKQVRTVGNTNVATPWYKLAESSGQLRNILTPLFRWHCKTDSYNIRKMYCIVGKEIQTVNQKSETNFLLRSILDARKTLQITNDEILGNANLFLFAAYETVSATAAFTTYLLAKHQDVQDRLRKEILQAKKANSGNLDYATLTNLHYLDCVFNEATRLFPVVAFFTTRSVIEEFTFKQWKIPAGMSIVFPTYQIHHNEKLWPNPYVFDPDRFSAERKDNISPLAFQPFGDGPRICPGKRIGILEVKLIIATLFSNYKVSLGEKHKNSNIELKCRGLFLQPAGPDVTITLEPIS